MSKISLTASMRSNLLSLQNISKQQDQTQLRLSTGLKVNSAIDNPSSYYTAQSLANRAADLSGLLDAMGQGIQIIKSANEGIEVAQNLIEQMKSIAEQVSPNVPVPDKEYFLDKEKREGLKDDFFYIKEKSQDIMLDQIISLCKGRLKNFGD